MKYRWKIFFCIGTLAIFANPVLAQHWKQIGTLSGVCSSGFFFDTQSGLVATFEAPNYRGGKVELFKTTDGGNKWRQITLPAELQTDSGSITSITMRDRATGWFSFASGGSFSDTITPYPPGVYQTIDSGNTWVALDSAQCNSVKFSAGKLYTSVGGVAPLNDSVCMISGGYTHNLVGPLNYVFDQTYLTSNSGNSWTALPFAFDAYGIYVQQSTGIFFVFPTLQDSGFYPVGATQVTDSPICWYSQDTGQHWMRGGGISNSNSDSPTGDIEGDGNAIYVQNQFFDGLYRSTDEGQTWVYVGGTWNGPQTRFCVISPCDGGTVVAFGSDGSVWLTMDGGDGLVGYPIPTGIFPSPDTMRITASSCGESILIPVPMQGQSIDSIDIQASIVSDNLHESYISSPSNFLLQSGDNDTLWINYLPRNGPHVSTIMLNFQNSWRCADWEDTQTIIITTPSTAQITAPAQLVGTCSIVSDSGYLSIDSCQSLIITQVKVLSHAANRLVFQSQLPDTVRNGYHNSLPFQFNPNDTMANDSARVEIEGQYAGSISTFDTIITISFEALGTAPHLVSPTTAIDFGTLSTCNGVGSSTSITFTNNGCAPDTITSLTLTGSGFTGSDDTLPIIVVPGDSVILEYHFDPQDSGMFRGQVSLNVVSMGLTENPVVGLSGSGIPAVASLSISDTGVNFGTFSQCGNPVADSTITITNTGCDSLALSGASVDAGSGFTLLNMHDTMLAPNESASFTINFGDSLARTWNSNFHIVGTGANGGNTIDTSVSLTATITPGSRSAAINLTSIDFGTTSICEERDSSVTITNTGCEPDTIFSGELSSLQFALDTSVQFPIVLMPDSSVTFPIFTHLDTTGHPDTINATLNFTLDSGVAVPSVMLTRSVTYPGEFSLSLAAEASAPLNTMVPVYILRHGTIPNQATEVDFDLVYNDDLLSYNAPLQPDIVPNGAATVLNGITDRPFKMSPATDRDTIATLQFLTYLTKNDSTAIQLVHQRFDASGIVSPSCVAAMDTTSTPSNFNLILTCGDSTIIASWNDTPPFSIESIQPNPASDAITIRVDAAAPGSIGVSDAAGGGSIHNINCEMYDALGREQDVRSTSLQSGVVVDVSGVPSGIYFLRLSAGGYVQSRSVVVSH